MGVQTTIDMPALAHRGALGVVKKGAPTVAFLLL
jgi:hypothetical protein